MVHNYTHLECYKIYYKMCFHAQYFYVHALEYLGIIVMYCKLVKSLAYIAYNLFLISFCSHSWWKREINFSFTFRLGFFYKRKRKGKKSWKHEIKEKKKKNNKICQKNLCTWAEKFLFFFSFLCFPLKIFAFRNLNEPKSNFCSVKRKNNIEWTMKIEK